MEKYLSLCLESLVAVQDSQDLLEVLVVNDGSKDRTGEIAHEFAAKHPDVVKVIDKPNGHYGSCINAGLKAASGMYVKVLDADDSFDTGALSRHLENLVSANQANIDVVFTDYVLVREDRRREDIVVSSTLPTECDFELDTLAGQKSLQVMHTITYRTEVLRKMDYHQTEGQPYTDNEWALLPMRRMGRMRYFSLPLYRYLLGREGQSVSPAQSLKNLQSHETILEHMINAAREGSDNPLYVQYAKKFVIDNAKLIYELAFFASSVADGNVKLDEWEAKLAEMCPDCLQFLDELVLDPRIPVHYIRGWRHRDMTRGCWMRSVRFLKWFLALQRRLRGLA